ncbi:flagellar export protein FliJ [Halalkalibacillus sediminis]|uniref:Flagellar FliJ protein n=1 Tax=Halalkalibacillus sediminis TaxID=2018042 RepID=A0A2I0QWA6_9BACI|nr:flagellar export protein FliJ [Halalkalibacillus sediminis]PKR78621.1 flagellar export protein FliJ [Halalkalibacillus sediminis]
MSSTQSFEKIQQLKEKELEDAQVRYNRSIDHFETVATDLYDLLKNKESAVTHFNEQISKRSKGFEIHSANQYLQTFQTKEQELQMKVHQARVNMQQKQDALNEALQEVKKLETIIDHKKYLADQLEKKNENKFLDEISVQQYFREMNR